MVYRGRVKNGVVVLDNGGRLPDGTEVRVEPFSRGRTSRRSGRHWRSSLPM